MPRKPLVRSDVLPYHVTARVNNRESFHLPFPKMWEIIGNESLNLNWTYGVEFHSLVMMPNHLHMLVTTPKEDLGKVMNVFMSYVTRTSNLCSGRSGHLFGKRYHWSVIKNSGYFARVYKYVYRNPVRANLCEKVEQYPYSTLHGCLGSSPLPIPLHITRVGLEIAFSSLDASEQLNWLNRPFPNEEEKVIRKALRKRIIENIVVRKTRRPVEGPSYFL